MRTVTKAYRRSRQRSQFLTLERAAQNGSGIPDGWRTVPLRSLCLATELTDPTKSPATSFQYIDVSAVSNDLWKITGSTEHLGTTAPSRARKLVGANDVIFATVRPMLRRIAMIPEYLDGQIVSTAFCVLRANPTQADSRFIYYTLLTDEFIERIGNLQRGASYPAVTDGDVLGQEILIPPLAEQRAISAVLSKIQAAVEVQETIVATLKELKAATMAKLFREGLRSEPLRQTEIGEIPEGWGVIPLGQLLRTAQYGLSVRGEKTGRYPILRMNCQEEGEVVFRDLQYIDLDEATFNSFKLNDGDLLFNRTNSIDLVGRTAIFRGAEAAVFASYLIRLRLDESMILPDLLNYYLNLERVQVALKALATRGVSQSNISASKLRLFHVPLPPKQEQAEIIKALYGLTAPLEAAIRKRNILRALFSSMLHLLMTGKVRVNRVKLGEEQHGKLDETTRNRQNLQPFSNRPHSMLPMVMPRD